MTCFDELIAVGMTESLLLAWASRSIEWFCSLWYLIPICEQNQASLLEDGRAQGDEPSVQAVTILD